MNFHVDRLITCLIGGLALLVIGCAQETQTGQTRASSAAVASSPMDRLPDSQAGEVVRRAIEAAGGWSTWTAKKNVTYRKVITSFDSTGDVERTYTQRHRYILHPTAKMCIEYENAQGQRILLVNNGMQVRKWVNGKRDSTKEGQNHAWNSTFGSHYVFAHPFKLTDPGTNLTYAGRDTLPDGTVADAVRATYDSTAGSAGGMHTWTYYFDVDDHRLVANHLTYGPDPGDHSFTEYTDYQTDGDLRIHTQRVGYASNAQAERLRKASTYTYENVRFNAPLPDSLFALSR